MKRRAFRAADVPEYWIVDADARTVERWRPTDVRPEVIDDSLSWHPAGASEAFALDVGQFFGDVSDDA